MGVFQRLLAAKAYEFPEYRTFVNVNQCCVTMEQFSYNCGYVSRIGFTQAFGGNAKTGHMKDWKEYIESYFSDKALFKVTFEASKNLVTIVSSSSNIKTRLDFVFIDSRYERLVEIQFCNGFENSESYCIQYLGEETFSEDLKCIVDDILIVPVKKGWIEKDFYFILKKPYRTMFFFNETVKKDYVAYNSLIGIFSLFGLLSKSKQNTIQPIIPK